MTLLVRTEGVDEQPPLPISEGVIDLTNEDSSSDDEEL